MSYTILITEPDNTYAQGDFDTHDQAEIALYKHAETLEDYEEEYTTSAGYNDGQVTMSVIFLIK